MGLRTWMKTTTQVVAVSGKANSNALNFNSPFTIYWCRIHGQHTLKQIALRNILKT
jgi:hypothetical protein